MSVVLIVEDNEKNLILVRDVLRFNGYQTVEAMTGNEGIRMAKEHRPALILMDIQLPDISGIAALQAIRADATIPKMPVLAVSASVMPQDQKQILASGFDGYLTKPLNIKGFVETVEKFIGKAS